MDQIDYQILEYLKQDSRMQWKEIGEKVHFSGPAVAARISKMQSLGIIKRFTVDIDEDKLEKKLKSFIVLYMKCNDHAGLQQLVHSRAAIIEAHRISGQGCYLFKVSTKTQAELIQTLNDLSHYGTYQVNISIDVMKG